MIACVDELHFRATCESCGSFVLLSVELRELAIMQLIHRHWRVREMRQTWCPSCARASLEDAPPTSPRRGG